ncbi:MAG: hypothetical protein ACP5OG_03740 [Candidatus Nanoarchaeia archaeon]
MGLLESIPEYIIIIGSIGFVFLFFTSLLSFYLRIVDKKMNSVLKWADEIGDFFIVCLFLWIFIGAMSYFVLGQTTGYIDSHCFAYPIEIAFYGIWPALITGGIVGFVRGD